MKRFEALDGLRGLAALTVVWFHGSHYFKSNYIPEHAYLAVDFFFCLSGFVVSHAYDKRLGAKMSAVDFFVKRLIRLYPMILVGVLLGGLALTSQALALKKMTLEEVAVLTISAFLLIPAGFAYNLQAFPANNPIWSLFFEFFANGFYVLEKKTLKSGKFLFSVGLLLSFVGLVIVASLQGGVESVGFGDPVSFWGGFARVTFPFFAGVFLHRFGLYKAFPQVNPILSFAALMIVLLCPLAIDRRVYDLLAIAVALPLIVGLAANSLDQKHAIAASIFLGELSYPIYLIHQPIFRIVAGGLSKFSGNLLPKDLCILLVTLLCVALSLATLVFIDRPVRRWLGGMSAKSKNGNPLSSVAID